MYTNYSNTAEQGIIICSIRNPDEAYTAVESLNPDDFYDMNNRFLFSSICSLVKKSVTPDFATVVTEAENQGYSSAAQYLSELTDVFISSDIKTHIEAVKEKSRQRFILDICRKAEEDCTNGNSSEYVINKIYGKLLGMEQNKHDITPITKAYKDVITRTEEFKAARDSGASVGINTGIPKLDNILCGLMPGQLIILGACSGVGKTALALNIADYISKAHTVLYVSLEMTAAEIAGRLIAGVSGVPLKKIKSGLIKTCDIDRLKSVQGSEGLFINDNFSQTAASITAAAHKLKRRKGLDFMVVDYLQLMGRDRTLGDVQALDELTRQLKIMAGDLNIPILVLSQLSRDVNKRDGGNTAKPKLSDLRGSGAIEQNADVVLLLHRPDNDNKQTSGKRKTVTLNRRTFFMDGDFAILNIAKHRSGERGDILLSFNGERFKFSEVDVLAEKGIEEVETELPKEWR